jgi:hypothetical protein
MSFENSVAEPERMAAIMGFGQRAGTDATTTLMKSPDFLDHND